MNSSNLKKISLGEKLTPKIQNKFLDKTLN